MATTTPSRIPERTCVGCRTKSGQAALVRFTRREGAWVRDDARERSPGRGVYLCSLACAERAKRNRRYPGLGTTAAATLGDGV